MQDSDRAELESHLGHRFAAPARLEHALTHSSHSQPAARGEGSGRDNERLEFLGDAVLGLLVSEHLTHACPDWEEGKLSTAKAQLVSKTALAEVARRLDLGRFLRLGRGEEKSGVRENRAVLADTYEAILAAVYLDAGLDAARGFVTRTLLQGMDRARIARLGRPDHKSSLQDYLQARGMPLADYRSVRESGPDHRKRFVVEVRVEGRTVATGEGTTKKEAEQAAARLALEQLGVAAEKL